MRISFIIPVYNTNSFLLARCVDSIKKITACEKEIIIIDDGSDVKETIILEEELIKTSEVVLIKQNNRGPSSARNCGLKNATGDYIVFVDSDDYLLSENFSRILAKTKDYDYDILYFSHEKAHIDNVVIRANSVETLTKKTKSLGYSFDFWVVWGKIYRKSCFEGCYFNESIRYCEDVLLNMQILKKVTSLYAINTQGIVHEINENSLCNRYNTHAAEYFGKTILELELYCDEDRKRGFYKEVIFNFFYRNVLPLQVFNKNNKASFWKKNVTACNILYSEPYLHAFRGLEVESFSLRNKVMYELTKCKLIFLAYIFR